MRLPRLPAIPRPREVYLVAELTALEIRNHVDTIAQGEQYQRPNQEHVVLKKQGESRAKKRKLVRAFTDRKLLQVLGS